MKCPNCEKDIFPKQFKCDHCGFIVALGKKSEKKEVKEKKKNGKRD